MKTIVLIICCASAGFAGAQTKKPPVSTKPQSALLRNALDSFSYAVGVEGASYYRQQGAPVLNTELVKKAFDDVYAKKTLQISTEQTTKCIQQNMQNYMSQKLSTEKDAGKIFLASNKKRPGVTELPNGLQYEVITQGTGNKPQATDTVKAHYRGTLISGVEFDNSYKRGEPLQIPVNGVIAGWTQALEMMPVGSKWKLFIPSDLAYGDRGAGGVIPGGATLIFDIELLDIIKK
ncbi:MAG: FKBP-type peptidyl-prolyl cis-trans isomerase [Ginsengibacter sp.]